MNVNIDGLRRNATGEMNNLADIIERACFHLEEDDKEELIQAFDEAAASVDMFNCVYSDSVENFSNLSDKLNIRRLEVDNE